MNALPPPTISVALLEEILEGVRAPLTEILEALQRVASGSAHTDRAYAASFRLLSVVNDAVDFVQLARGPKALHLTSMCLRQVVEDAFKVAKPDASKKDLKWVLSVQADVPKKVTGDYGKIHQVLVYLLRGAAARTARGAVIVEVLKRDDFFYELRVRDTGSGLDERCQRETAAALREADFSAATEFGHLGFLVCASLCTSMEGSLFFHTAAGLGTSFGFTIPIRVAPPS